MSDFDIRRVAVSDVLPLRGALFRRRRPGDATTAGDDHPAALHIAAYSNEAQVGIGSIHPEPMPNGYSSNAWRIHDVAVDHGHRGLGIGAIIVERCLEHAAGSEARAAWCVAPASAYGFFERYGFRRTGDPTEGNDGPSYLLFVELKPLRRSWELWLGAKEPEDTSAMSLPRED